MTTSEEAGVPYGFKRIRTLEEHRLDCQRIVIPAKNTEADKSGDTARTRSTWLLGRQTSGEGKGERVVVAGASRAGCVRGLGLFLLVPRMRGWGRGWGERGVWLNASVISCWLWGGVVGVVRGGSGF